MGGGTSTPLVGGFTYLEDVTLGFFDDTFPALGNFPGESRAVAWVDYDLDGDLDLYFTVGPLSPGIVVNNLWQNNGDGTFTDVSALSGILALPGQGNFVSATWGDYNNDGCQDVYLVNSIGIAERFLLRNKCDGTFQDVTSQAGVAGRSNGRSRDAAWADFDQDGFLDLFVAYDDLAGPNQLFRNNHNGAFTDVAAGVGLANVGSGFNANWGDFNNDGWPDLFLVRSGTQSDILYKNNGDGTFLDFTPGSGIVDTAQGTDAVWGDFNNDGFLDLYVVGATGINHLFRNNGGTSFTDTSTPPTVANAGNSFGSTQGATVGDLDNDGDLDIVVVQSFDGRAGSQQDVVFRNDGGVPLTFAGFAFQDAYNSYAACFGDYSGDGAPDLFTGNVGSGTDVLWLNAANRNDALVVLLHGTKSNRLGIGVRVSVTADLDGNPATTAVTQTREMIGGSKGQNPIEISFGLGRTAVETRKVDNLTIVWPRSGIMQSFPNLAVNQVITVIEGTQGLIISSVSPSSGTIAGGTTVVVTGLNFDPDAEVRFGGLLTPVTSRSGSTSITVTTPPHAAGPVDVTVTNLSRAADDPLRQGNLPNGYVYFSDVQQSLFVFDGVNTTLVWGENPGQVTYDAIRGNLGAFQETGGQVNLGPVICLENDSIDNTTAPNHLDRAMPAVGQGFFYLVRFGGSYGTSSAGSVEVPASGDCP